MPGISLRPWLTLILGLAWLLSGCSSEPHAPDGQLDCPTDITFAGFASYDERTVGTSDPAAALVEALAPYRARHGGEVVVVDEWVGLLVVNGREVVVVIAAEAPAGGWIVTTSRGCDGFGT
jgi:hypothetical protein